MELEMEAEKICLQLPISVMSSKAIQRNVFLPQLASWKGDRAGQRTSTFRALLRGELWTEVHSGTARPADAEGNDRTTASRDRGRKSEDLFPEMADAIRRVSRCGDQSGIMEQSLCQQGIEGGTSEKTLKSECHQEKGVRTQSENWCQWKEKRRERLQKNGGGMINGASLGDSTG